MLNAPERKIVTLDIDSAAVLDQSLISELNGACDIVEEAGSEATLLVRINGRSGFSVEGSSFRDQHLVSRFERALRRVERLAALTIGVATDAVGEIGLAVSLCTDYRIGNESLRLGLGGGDTEIVPTMALYRLVNQIGTAKSRQSILFGREIGATEALECGLVNEIVSDPVAATRAFIESLNRSALVGLPLRRQLMLETALTSFDNALGTHLAACERVLRNAQRQNDR